MLRRVRKGRLGLPVECGLSASPERTEQERGKTEKWRWGQFCPIIEVGGGGEEEKTMSRAGQCRGWSGKVRVWRLFAEEPGVDVK